MYKQHATKIQAYAQRSADNMADVCLNGVSIYSAELAGCGSHA